MVLGRTPSLICIRLKRKPKASHPVDWFPMAIPHPVPVPPKTAAKSALAHSTCSAAGLDAARFSARGPAARFSPEDSWFCSDDFRLDFTSCRRGNSDAYKD